MLCNASAQQLMVEKYAGFDGLSNNQVSCIIKDDLGFIWVGTSDGLNRFDGRKFRVFKHDAAEPNSMSGNIIFNLCKSPNGNIWAATPQGICYYDQEQRKIIRLTIPKEHASEFVFNRRVFVDSGNKVWFNSEKGVVCHDLNKNTWNQYKIERIAVSTEVFQIMEDRQKNIWIVSIEGLFMLDKKREFFAESTKKRNKKNIGTIPRIMIQDEKNTYYVGLWADGIANFNISDKAFTEKTDSYTFWSMSATDDPEILFAGGTFYGVYKLDKTTDKLVRYDLYNSNSRRIEESMIHCIYKDDQGIIWLGSELGLLKHIPQKMNIQSIRFDKIGIEKNTIVPGSIFYDPYDKNKLWFSIWTGGIYRIDLNSGETEVFSTQSTQKEKQLPGKYINYLGVDKKKNIWAGTSGAGLLKFDRRQNSFKDAYISSDPSEMINVHISSLSQQKKDTLCFVSSGRGFFEFVPENNYYKAYDTGKNNAYKPEFVTDMIFTKAGDAFLISSDRGCYFFNKLSGEFSSFLEDSNKTMYPSIYSRDMIKDGKGNIWITTLEGLVKINESNLIEKIYTTNDGLPSNMLSGIITDSNGGFIISSDLGLIHFKPENQSFVLYNFSNGLFTDKDISIYYMGDDKMALGYKDGILILDMGQFKSRKTKFPLVMNAIKILNTERPFHATMEYTLQPDENMLSLHFSLLDYESKLPLTYEFQLNNEREEWVNLGSNPDILFSNLSPGAYKLNVRARSRSSSEWSMLQAPILFTVLPPYYQAWWFIALSILFIMSIIYSIYKFRINKMLEMEGVRLRISRDLHDDIGSTLSSINILTNSAQKRFEEKDDLKLADSLNKISDRTQRTLDNMSDIIWNVKPENDSLDKIMSRMREYASTLLEAKKIPFSIDFPDDIHHINMSLEVKHAIFLIYKEALNNLVKYSECTSATVHIKIENKIFYLTITDNGKGFNLKESHKHYSGGDGVQNMQRRAKEINAKLEIISLEQQGTIINLELHL